MRKEKQGEKKVHVIRKERKGKERGKPRLFKTERSKEKIQQSAGNNLVAHSRQSGIPAA